ncbi:MAG TPA: hypothetical protein VGK59_03430, partial [Ohtaekwangia sp.]
MRGVIAWVLLCTAFNSVADPQPEVSFIPNKNQWNKDVLFYSPVQSGSLIFYNNRIQFLFRENIRKDIIPDKKIQKGVPLESGDEEQHSNGHLVQVQFISSNIMAEVSGEGQLTTRYNYFLSGDRSRWASNVPAFEKVHYSEMYCGIDLLYYSQGKHVKYEWIVSPLTDPRIIQMEYSGIDNLELHDENLYFKTSVNEVWEMKPVAYQVKNGNKVVIPCRYKLQGKTVQYEFPEGYDECETLI